MMADLSGFREYLESLGRATLTVRGYVQDMRDFARWFEGTNGVELSPERLTSQDVREYRQHLLAVRRAKPALVNRRIAAIRAYVRWGRREGLIQGNPLEGVRPVREQERGPRWLTRQERNALVRELELMVQGSRTAHWRLQAIRDRAVVFLMLHAGLRVGELVALEVGDIELGERRGEVRVRHGKGGKERTVPLNAEARRALRDWLEVRPKAESPYLFVGKGGERLRDSGVQRRVAEIGRRAGVELTPHVLRHTFARMLVEAGVGLERVAALLGHESLDTTKVYLTPSMADLQEAVERVSG
jgi:integrase/recombinase XerC